MDWLNYRHLFYFWTVVREGGISKAARVLRLTQPTVSAQLKTFEAQLGDRLLERVGRRLVPTAAGQLVFRYAEEIFGLGRELQEALQGRPTGQPRRLSVGIADVVPKLIAYRLLEPALTLPEPTKLVCRDDRPERLLAGLALHEYDVVLTDAPLGAGATVRAYSHLLGESAVTIFAVPTLAAKLRRGFPGSLEGAPLLLPPETTSLRRSLTHFFTGAGIHPRVAGEFEDSALLNAFGQAGVGAFAAPTVIAPELCAQFGVRAVGELPTLRERYYALTVERRIKHPAVVALSEHARDRLFASARGLTP